MPDINTLMGLLGGNSDPQTTGATASLAAAAPAQAPAQASGAVPYDGSDPELRFYAQQGIDPDYIRQKRWNDIQNMSTILMAASGRGVDSSNLGQQLAAASNGSSKDIKSLFDAKQEGVKTQLEKAKLSLAQQKLLQEQVQQEQYNNAIKNGVSVLQSLAGGGATAGAPRPSLSSLAGESPDTTAATPAPAQAPADPQTTGAGPLPAGLPISDLPGQNGNPRLAVAGTGANQLAEPARAPVPASPALQTVGAQGLVAAAKADPRVAQAVSILTPQQAAIAAAMMPLDPKGTLAKIMDLAGQKTYESYQTKDGYLIQRDNQSGHVEAPVDMRTEAQKLAAKAREQAVQNAGTLELEKARIPVEAMKSATLNGVDITPYGPGQWIETNRLTGAGAIKGSVPDNVKADQKDAEGKRSSAELAIHNLNNAQDIRDLADKAFMGPGSGWNSFWATNGQRFSNVLGLPANASADDALAATNALKTKLGQQVAERVRASLPGQRLNRQEFEYAKQWAAGDLSSMNQKSLGAVLDAMGQDDRNNLNEYSRSRDRMMQHYKGTKLESSQATSYPDYSGYQEPKTVGGKRYVHDGLGWRLAP